jgi:hypothetical protein
LESSDTPNPPEQNITIGEYIFDCRLSTIYAWLI